MTLSLISFFPASTMFTLFCFSSFSFCLFFWLIVYNLCAASGSSYHVVDVVTKSLLQEIIGSEYNAHVISSFHFSGATINYIKDIEDNFVAVQ